MRLRITLAQSVSEVAALVALAAEGIETEDLSVWVKNCSRAFAGRAYFEARHCVVRIGRPSQFPILEHHYPRLKTAPTYDLNSWQEALVLVTAHELRHQQQFRNGWRPSEIDAERWALARLLAFRDSQIRPLLEDSACSLQLALPFDAGTQHAAACAAPTIKLSRGNGMASSALA